MNTTLLVVLMSLILQGAPQTVAVPIQNPSFEEVSKPLAPEMCGTHFIAIAGWHLSDGNSSGYQPANPNPCGISLPPDGKTVALSANGSTITQTLQIPQMPVGIYTLKVWVGNYFYWYAGGYIVSLSLDTIRGPLCSASGHPIGDFTEIVAICPIRDQPATNLTISLSGTSGLPTLFDNVSLTFTPVR